MSAIASAADLLSYTGLLGSRIYPRVSCLRSVSMLRPKIPDLYAISLAGYKYKRSFLTQPNRLPHVNLLPYWYLLRRSIVLLPAWNNCL